MTPKRRLFIWLTDQRWPIGRLLLRIHRSWNKRQAFIRRHLDPDRLRIAEVGALDRPTFSPHRYQTKFIDYATSEQMARDKPDEPRFAIGRTVTVDYAVPDLNYSALIPERFDLIIASHVIEHIPDTIQWFAGLREILAPGGYIFLAVPDRRYTFDYLRRETTLADVLRAHRERLTKPDKIQIFDHLFHFRPIRGRDAWRGTINAKIGAGQYTAAEAWAEAERQACGPYANVHCHVYTFESFMTLFANLRERGFIQFEIVDCRDVAQWRNEFHVLLRADE
jgi:SAM-dependent methyltransferase